MHQTPPLPFEPTSACFVAPEDFATRQAEAYDQLFPVYESRHDLLQPIRHVVLDRVFEGLEPGCTVLEIGCGTGACMELMRTRNLSVEGIDLSPDMVQAARLRTACRVTQADFRTYEFDRTYDLVFAQAFVHLFSKADLFPIIYRFKALARERIYFSTSLAPTPDEGWHFKDGVKRFRSFYTALELEQLLRRFEEDDPNWKVSTFNLVDPLRKEWVNVLIDRC